MKICFIGKYPPIQGGASTYNYWAAYGLADRGHEIYMVTNANEVEDESRIHLQEEDKNWYQPTFEHSGGFVRVFNPERFNFAKMAHIPVANPFVSKLASVVTQVVRQYQCEAILAHYYEPYAIAGYLASLWTDLPLAVLHAGSDLERLMRVPDLATTYKEILKSADYVITRRDLRDRFIGIGVNVDKIYSGVPFRLPTMFFNPQVPSLDVKDFPDKTEFGLALNNKGQIHRLDNTKPTVGIYGKVAQSKGTYDLMSALSVLKREGLDFNFLAMVGGHQSKQFRSAIEASDLEECTWVLPFLPPWRVAKFIRTCTAVCFLQRDFPIGIHRPMVPREILACGTCLILSGDIAGKQIYRDNIVHQENMLIVPDPKNHEDLAGKLRFVVQKPRQTRRIGAQGHLLTEQLEDFSSFVDGFEALLHRFTGKLSTSKPFSQLEDCALEGTSSAVAELKAQSSLARTLEQAMPWTRLLLLDGFDDLVSRFREQRIERSPSKFKVALHFCTFLERELKNKLSQAELAPVENILQYQKAQLAVTFDDDSERLPPYSAVDALEGREVALETVRDLKPLMSNYSRIETFSYDVTPLFCKHLLSSNTPLRNPREILSTFKKETTLVCFYKTPNLVRYELKINSATRELLKLCNGARSISSITQILAEAHYIEAATDRNELQGKIISLLKRLYSIGIIIFCSEVPGGD